MKFEVRLSAGTRIFTESVQASNPQDARRVAEARNPNARVIAINAKF